MTSVSAVGLKALRKEIVHLLSIKENAGGLPPYSLDDVGKKLGILQLSAGTTQRETRILQQLFFSDIFAREDSIENAHDKTFSWILMQKTSNDACEMGDDTREMSDNASETRNDTSEMSDDSGDMEMGKFAGKMASWAARYLEQRENARGLLQQWLTDGSGILHISGKPGAGKSTLMKLIYNHPTTKTLLEKWAGGTPLIFVPFFFWNSGSKLQMSLQGLYRTLLYHVLAQCPALIPDVLPEQWKDVSYSSRLEPSILDSQRFRPDDIKNAFDRLMDIPLSSDKFKVCFFIDGLDEFEAHAYDHKKLAIQLCQWSAHSNIKICVSSRPHLEFLDTFPSENRINLHEVTALDIWRLGCDMFEKDENFERVRQIYQELVNGIVWQAEGVILWAQLALKSVIYEVSLNSSHVRLREKLSSLPREMDKLYDKMLANLDESDRLKVDLILYLVRFCNKERYRFWAPYVAWLDDVTQSSFPSSALLRSTESKMDYEQFLEDTKRQLLGLTKGLLTVRENFTYGNIRHYKVTFFHRTVGDYLGLQWRQKRFKEAFSDTYLPDVVFRLNMCFLARATKAGERWPGRQFLHDGFPDAAFHPMWICYTGNFVRRMEEIYSFLGPCIPPRFTILGSKRLNFEGRYDVEPQVSLVHHAAYYGLSPYLEKNMDVIKNSELQAHHPQLTSAAAGVQDLSILLTTTICRLRDPDRMKLLLDSGFSTQFRLREYEFRVRGKTLHVPTGGSASFWAVFVAYIAAHLGGNVGTFRRWPLPPEYWESEMAHAFDIMELVLRAHPPQDVVLLFCREYEPVLIRLRDFVLLHSPRNKNQLLELLPTEDQHPKTWPHVGPLMARCREFRDYREGVKPVPEELPNGVINATFYTSLLLINGSSDVPIAVVSRSEKVEIGGTLGFRVW